MGKRRGSKGFAEDLEAMETALSAPAPPQPKRIPDNLLYYGDNLDILRRYPRLQILAIEDLLNGKKIDIPPWHEAMSFKRSPKAKGKAGTDAGLF